MAFIKQGIISSDEAFGRQNDYEKAIKKIGWQQCPFTSLITTAAPSDRSGNVAAGHTWWYDTIPDGDINNAHLEGGKPSTPNSYGGDQLINHYQIVKESFAVTGTETQAKRVNGQAILASQREMANIKMKKTIEKILLSDQAAVQRQNNNGIAAVNGGIAGKVGGLKSFSTADNTKDAGGEALTWALLRECLKVGWKNSGEYRYVMMSDRQKDAIDDIIFNKTVPTNMAASKLENNVTQIAQTAYNSRGLSIVLNPFLGDDEVIFFNPSDIIKVNWRPLQERKLPTGDDAEIYELTTEFTLRVCTPHAFYWLKGLKV